MKKTLILLISLAATAMGTWADNIPEDEARKIAEAFLGKVAMARTGVGAESRSLELVHTAKTYYAFNRGNKDGFVIVANDDMVTTPVLGYADNGEFRTEGMPANMRWWLSVYEKEITSLQARKFQAAPRITRAAEKLENIEPLIQTKWDQGAPYNDLSPTYKGQKCFTGCVATAMAQVIYHHRWPNRGRGSNTYAWSYKGEFQRNLSSNFSSHVYDYDAMALNYNDGKSHSETETKAVAQLMYDAGVSVDMEYGPDASGAQDAKASIALYKYFNYDRSVLRALRDLYGTREWEQMLHADLAANQPIFYTGGNKDVAHAFVIDGYQDGYFHVNWGWSGVSDGYFLITVLDPSQQGIGGGAEGYNSYQTATLNVKRPQTGSTFSVLFYSDADFSVEKVGDQGNYSQNATAKFTSPIWNGTITAQSASMGIRVVSENEKDTTYIKWPYTNVSIEPLHGYVEYEVSLTSFPRTEGKYIVTPAVCTSNGKWHNVKTYVGRRQHIVATVENKRIQFTYPEDYTTENLVTNVSFSGKAFAGKTKTITVSLENTGEREYYSSLQLHILKEGATESVDYKLFNPQLYAKEKKEYTINLTMPATTGKYELLVTTTDGTQLCERTSITVNRAPTTSAPPTLNTQLEVENADEVSPDNINLYATLTCKKGYFENYIGSAVLNENLTFVDNTIYYTYTSICEGEVRRMPLPTGFSASLKEGKTYYATAFYYTGSEWKPLNYLGERGLVKFHVVATTGIVTIGTESTPTEEDILVYNVSGTLVLKQQGGETVDLSSLPHGIYIIKQGKTSKRVLKK